jgi:uncharacterized protein YjiK
MKFTISLVFFFSTIVTLSQTHFTFDKRNDELEAFELAVNSDANKSSDGAFIYGHQNSPLNDARPKREKHGTDKDPWSVKALQNAQVFDNAPYNLLHPEKTYKLPDILKEVSGIRIDHEGRLYCVQDELGVVFQYDLENALIAKQYRFANAGDFEDISVKGDSIFVLRSDGTIFGFRFAKKGTVSQFSVSLDATDYESLTYDEQSGRFYIVSKDHGAVTGKTKRVIFSFKGNQASKPKAELTIDIPALNNMLKQRYPKLAAKKFKFNPSAIAFDPKTKDFYVLSANDRILVIYNSEGVKGLYPLPSELYHKPEGLAFGHDGSLYISNEGEKRGLESGMIYKFSPQ